MKFSILAIAEIKPDFVSRMIMKVIGAPYSHIAILVDGKWAYHATEPGFHRSTLEELLFQGTPHAIMDRADFELSQERSLMALGWLDGRVGTAYSMLQWWGFLLPWSWVRRLVANGKAKTVCSEMGADFLEECLGSDCGLVENDFLTPRDVIESAKTFAREFPNGK